MGGFLEEVTIQWSFEGLMEEKLTQSEKMLRVL